MTRKNLPIHGNAIAVNLAPSSRALVNATGYGIEEIHVGENKPDHDDLSHIAAELLEKMASCVLYLYNFWYEIYFTAYYTIP